MNAERIEDGLNHRGHPIYAPLNPFQDGIRRHRLLKIVGRAHIQMPGEDRGDEEDDGLDPGTGTESEPNSLPDEAPPVESEDFDGNRAALKKVC